MSRLEIRNRHQGERAYTSRDLQIFLDGVEIKHLRYLSLELEPDGLNTAKIEFFVDEIEIDAAALAALHACIKQGKREGKA